MKENCFKFKKENMNQWKHNHKQNLRIREHGRYICAAQQEGRGAEGAEEEQE